MSMTASIIARLKTRPEFRLVAGAGELAALERAPATQRPAAYVLVAEQTSGDNDRVTGPVLQLCETDFVIVLVTGRAGDARGEFAAADIEALTGAVRATLIGWTPEGAETPFEHVSGKILQARDGRVMWEERLTTTIYIEGADHG